MKERLVRFRSFWIFPGLAVILLLLTRVAEPIGQIRDLIWLFPLGLFAWTLIEYGLHRFVFHVEIANTRLRRLVNSSHMEHHAEPRSAEHLLVKTGYGMAVSGLLYGIALAVTQNWVDAAGIMSGIWAGFLYYEFVHYRVHLTIGNSPLMAYQRRTHFHHHFRDSGSCFGVTTPLWDYVFRTAHVRD